MTKKKTAAFSAEVLDELLAGQDPATLLSSEGLLGELKKALAERMLNAEMARIWALRPNNRPAITATARVRRRFWVTMVRSYCRFPGIATVALIRR